MTTKADIHSSITAVSSVDIADLLLNEYDEIVTRFAAGDYRPTELSGGRFAEVAIRVCQSACGLAITPIGKTLPKFDKLVSDLELTPTNVANDGYRIHIPRALKVIYDFRNKRDVGHIGAGDVIPNYPDSVLVLSICSWVLTEIVRLSHKCNLQDAQRIVDDLVDRKVPLIWEQDGIVRVLDPSLNYKDKSLLVLYHYAPEPIDEKRLFEIVEYSTLPSYRNNILRALHNEAMIDYRDSLARIMPTGKRYVEQNILAT